MLLVLQTVLELCVIKVQCGQSPFVSGSQAGQECSKFLSVPKGHRFRWLMRSLKYRWWFRQLGPVLSSSIGTGSHLVGRWRVGGGGGGAALFQHGCFVH